MFCNTARELSQCYINCTVRKAFKESMRDRSLLYIKNVDTLFFEGKYLPPLQSNIEPRQSCAKHHYALLSRSTKIEPKHLHQSTRTTLFTPVALHVRSSRPFSLLLSVPLSTPSLCPSLYPLSLSLLSVSILTHPLSPFSGPLRSAPLCFFFGGSL